MLREAFYNGAQKLFTEHFTSCAPFPAREIIDAACKEYPEPPPVLREVEFYGLTTRFNPGFTGPEGPRFEVLVGGVWHRAAACEASRIEALHDLMHRPYTVAAP
jgi:hypothetical protein